MRSPIVRSPIAVLFVLVAASLQAHRQARGSPNLRQRQRALHRRVVAGGWQGDLSNRVLALGKLTGWKRIIPPPPPGKRFVFFLLGPPAFPTNKNTGYSVSWEEQVMLVLLAQIEVFGRARHVWFSTK